MIRWAGPTRTTWWAIAIAMLTTAGTAAYLAAMYPSLPHGVPVQFEQGMPAIFSVKTPMMVALPAIVQLGLLIVFGALMLLLLWRSRRGAGEVGRDADGARMRLAAEGVALLAAVWIAVQALGAVRLVVLWRLDVTSYGAAYWFAIATAIVAAVVIAARTMKLVGDGVSLRRQ